MRDPARDSCSAGPDQPRGDRLSSRTTSRPAAARAVGLLSHVVRLRPGKALAGARRGGTRRVGGWEIEGAGVPATGLPRASSKRVQPGENARFVSTIF